MAIAFNKWCTALHAKNLEEMLDLYDTEAVLLPTFSDKLCVGRESIQAYFIEFMKKAPHCELVSSRQIDKDDVTIFNGFYDFSVGSDIIKARFSFIISDQGKYWHIILP